MSDRSGRRRARALLPLCALLAVASCGSTLQPGSSGSAAGSGFPGGSERQTQRVGSSLPAGSPLAGGEPTVAGGPAGATTSGGTTGPIEGTATTGSRDRTPIRLGIFYLNGGNAVISAGFGNTPVSFGDGQLEARAVVDDVNRHGGAGGRKIEPYFAKVEAANANGAGLEAACTQLAQDDKVFAVMSMFNVRSQLAECAAKHRLILMDVALGGGDDYLYRLYRPWLFTPTQLSLDREQSLVLKVAKATGRINPKARVGVLIQEDDQMYARVFKNTIEPTLKAWGVPYESAGIASAAATNDIANAILRFKVDGVTQVIFSAGNGGIPEVFFMQAAEQQDFRPGYVMGDSTDTWFVGSQAPPNQVRRIFGAGTYPIANVEVAQYPTTPRERRCLEVIRAAGEQVSDRHSSLTATFYCELIYGFAAVAARVPGALTPEKWRAAYYALGSAYVPVTAFHSNLANGRNDNPDQYRLLGWKDACSCISYISDLRPLT